MLPTWRDVEIQSEIRNVRLQEAVDRQILSDLPESGENQRSAAAAVLVHLGNWMIAAGEQLRSRYGDVNTLDPQLRSAEQGC
jgi:hypothetical protein